MLAYSKEAMWSELILRDIATEDEIQLVTSINGYTIETLNDILYVRTGYRSLDQMEEEEHWA